MTLKLQLQLAPMSRTMLQLLDERAASRSTACRQSRRRLESLAAWAQGRTVMSLQQLKSKWVVALGRGRRPMLGPDLNPGAAEKMPPQRWGAASQSQLHLPVHCAHASRAEAAVLFACPKKQNIEEMGAEERGHKNRTKGNHIMLVGL